LLALELGMTVSKLSSRMTAAEEASWIALYKTDPFGNQRGDMRAALIAQVMHNIHAKKPRKLQEFMLFRAEPETQGDDASTIRKNFERLMEAQRK
jgi:hypothetical protein